MSQENAEVVWRGLDAFNRRDKGAWFAVCDPDVENLPPRE
jgi:ketosteroid isomerase-like protein